MQPVMQARRQLSFSCGFETALGFCGANQAMLPDEDRIRLVHKHRTELLDRIFGEPYRMPGWSAEKVTAEIVTHATFIRNALAESKEIRRPPRGLFLLALQQVVDSWIAALITEEAFEWLAERQT